MPRSTPIGISRPVDPAAPAALSRARWLRRGLWLVGLTTVWNVAEGIVAVAAGLKASSVALLGFGFDSGIETASGLVVGWRLWHELRGSSPNSAEQVERRTARVAGGLLILLAVYILVEAGRQLLGFGEEAQASRLGVVLTALSLVAMQFLGRAKLRAATALTSRALRADAVETMTCAWLSMTALVGLSLNALFGLSWADPVAALLVVPFLIKEGREGLRGEQCCACDE